MSGLSALDKTPQGVVIGFMQLQGLQCCGWHANARGNYLLRLASLPTRRLVTREQSRFTPV